MTKAARAGYHHGALREALLKQATKLLDKEGVEAVTIRAVARASGVTHAAPVNHFESRNALLTAMAIAFFRDLAQTINERVETEGDHRARARAYIEALVAYGLRHPHRYRLMWRWDILLDDQDLQRAMQGIYFRLIKELSSGRRIGGKDPHTVAVAMWSMAHGYVSMRIDGNFEDRKDDVTGQTRFEAMLDLIVGQ